MCCGSGSGKNMLDLCVEPHSDYCHFVNLHSLADFMLAWLSKMSDAKSTIRQESCSSQYKKKKKILADILSQLSLAITGPHVHVLPLMPSH